MEKVRDSEAALVTGATGFIGRRVLRPGDRALVRKPGSVVDEVVGDLLDTASLQVACGGVETVLHCAGHAHAFTSSDPEAHWRINFEGTRKLLQAAGEAGVKRFVFLSSVKAMAEPGEYCIDEDWPGEPVTPYGKAKRAAEQAVLAAGARYGMHVVNLRLAMVYGHGGRGNLERMAAGIRAGYFPPLPDVGNRRSLVHVDDVVAAIRLAAHDPRANGKTYIVAAPVAYSTRQIYDTLRACLQLPPIAWQIPSWVLRLGGRIGDGIGQMSGRTMPLNAEVVSRLFESACYSPARVQQDLGWVAKVSLIDGVRELLNSKGAVRP